MSAHVLDASTDLLHKALQDYTDLPPAPPPDSSSEEDADEESDEEPGNSLDVDEDLDEESDEESDDSLDVPDTVDPPARVVHPLLKPRHRPYEADELCEIMKITSLHTLPSHFMPVDTRRRIWRPPVMFYGWELDEDKILAFAREVELEATTTYSCKRRELEGLDIDPADVTDIGTKFAPDRVGVRTYSPLRTLEKVFSVYLKALSIEDCLYSSIRTVIAPDGNTTRIYAFYSNYYCDEAPTKKELEDLHWVMDENQLSGELKWWFSAMDCDWMPPDEPWPNHH